MEEKSLSILKALFHLEILLYPFRWIKSGVPPKLMTLHSLAGEINASIIKGISKEISDVPNS